jgi:hypothetical protein
VQVQDPPNLSRGICYGKGFTHGKKAVALALDTKPKGHAFFSTPTSIIMSLCLADVEFLFPVLFKVTTVFRPTSPNLPMPLSFVNWQFLNKKSRNLFDDP